MKSLNTQGIAHYLVLVIIIMITAIGGTYMIVSGYAHPSVNPWTNRCPGNSVKYGAPQGSTATASARKRVFGSPWPHANVSPVNFRGKTVYLNDKVIPCLNAVEWDLKYVYGSHYVLHTVYGASELNAQNPSKYFHAYGGAIDINPQQNPRCAGSCAHNMPKSWVHAFEAHGFYWGGNFPHTKDYMHFEWHGQI